MKLIRESGDGVYRIRAYDRGVITVNDERYEQALILSLDELLYPWSVADITALEASELEPVLSLGPEVVLLGTGDTQHFPPRAVMREVIQRGIGIEVMDTASACRTFNVLMSEGRRVVAALVP